MKETYVELEIYDVDYDTENPRIRGALEKYGKDKITPERIYFALRTGGEAGAATSGFNQLKNSIKAYGGISTPIRVISIEDTKICIDGNTRLAIYRDFDKKSVPGNWSKIPATMIEKASEVDIEKIRVAAHLVGARPWAAYEKAKYLSELYYKQCMSEDQLVELCGGNKTNIQEQMQAFHEMNEHYLERVANDGDFDTSRFSGFVELQKAGRKEAIIDAGFTLDDFGDWIMKDNITALAGVRALPKVLSDKEATEEFIKGGKNSIRKAVRIVENKEENDEPNIETLQGTDLSTLSRVLNEKIANLTFKEANALKEDQETFSTLHNLYDDIKDIIEHAGE